MAQELPRSVEKYAEKLALGRATRSRKVTATEQLERYTIAARRADATRVLVRQVLSGLGVSCIHYAYYFGFALAVDKCLRRREGASGQNEVRLVWQRWVGRGLDPRVLRRILVDVFSLRAQDVDTIARPAGV
ncbi:hypothetical protein JXB37_05880 [candidate division WOR-3 bacterium]|nr:hypothetical protein [candidate division WOR-3 bacterium]